MAVSLVLLLLNLLLASANLFLQHNATSTCPGGVISCECRGAVGFLQWAIEINGREVERITYGDIDEPGPASNKSALIMSVLAEALLLNVNKSVSPPIFTSVLNITLSAQDVNVTCRDFLGASSTAVLHSNRK